MSNTIDIFAEVQAHSGAVVFTEITVLTPGESEVFAEIEAAVISNQESIIHTEITAKYHNDYDVLTQITVPETIENTMHAKFFLYGRDMKDIETEIVPRAIGHRTIESEIYSRALGTGNIHSEISAIYRGNSDVFIEIQPMGFVQIMAEIEVRPHTNMSALYAVRKPPIISDSHFPIQDAFTKKESAYQTINYGKSSTMVIGNKDEFESFVKFETGLLDQRYIVTGITLELSYVGELIEGYDISLHTASRAWFETGLTYKNKPPKLNLVSNSYAVDPARRVVSFDITDVASKWLSGEEENNGFVISSTNKEPMYFRTSETVSVASKPKTIVQYYDSVIPSRGRSQIGSEIFIYNRGVGDVSAAIEVASTFSFELIPTEIYIHRSEVPLNIDKLAEITVSKGVIGTEITAIRSDKSEVFTVVTARSEQQIREKRAEIAVSRNFALTELIARQHDKSTIETDFYVSRPDALTELSVSVEDWNSIYIEITANDIYVSHVEAEIIARAIRSSDIFVEIEPNIKSDVLTEISVVRGSIPAEITVSVNRIDSIATELIARAIDDDEIQSELTVSKNRILTMITAAIRAENEVYTEIYASHRSEVFSEIYVSNTSEILTEIDVIGASMKQVEVTASREAVRTEIMVPFYDDADIPTEILPRILFADDIYCVITMGKVPKGYVFIL